MIHDVAVSGRAASAAGVDLDLCVYSASPHGFTGHPTPMAGTALDDIETWLAERLEIPVASIA